ncbi:MAG: ArsR/SmtB family transcription factor [Vicinamibacterales bacterium]
MESPLRAFKAQIFQALAHPTRIAVVDALRDGELTAGALAAHLTLQPANVSQHLSILRSKQIVAARKVGNQVYYTVRDPVLLDVLDLLRQYFAAHLAETAALLDEAHADDDAPPR